MDGRGPIKLRLDICRVLQIQRDKEFEDNDNDTNSVSDTSNGNVKLFIKSTSAQEA
jgi:hypothetical protein